MTGIRTILADDPMLNVRLRGKENHQPLKIVLDSEGKLPPDARVLAHEPQLLILAVTDRASREKIRQIERLGAQVIVAPEKEGRVDLDFLIPALGGMGIASILAETGGTLGWALARGGWASRIVTYIAPKLAGGAGAPTPLEGPGVAHMEEALRIRDWKAGRSGEDLRIEGWLDTPEKA
jgi:diaminohydroxyphosphoribosylaminopyrimidine deaminase/5-amino-6-(5-phosphoribosylamino)uracil reductase